ncbi:MAG: nitroreductase family protein, partial [Anaerovorax sp.]
VSGRDKTDQIMDMVLRWLEETQSSPEIKKYYEKGRNVVTLKAPSLLFVYGNKNVIAPQIDSMIALTTAELLLQAQGIGTCHAGYLRRFSNGSAEIRKFLGIPEDHEIFGVLTMGYADDESYLTIPERNHPPVHWI